MTRLAVCARSFEDVEYLEGSARVPSGMYEYARPGLLLSARARPQHLPLVVRQRPGAAKLSDNPSLHPRVANTDGQLVDYLLGDFVLRTVVHVVRMHDIHVVARAHHDVHPGRPGYAGESQRVSADADGRGIDDRPSAHSSKQRDFVDRQVFIEQFEVVDIAERVIPHPAEVFHRHLFLAEMLGARLGWRRVHAHEVDEDVLVRGRHPQGRGVYRPQNGLSKSRKAAILPTISPQC